MLGVLKCWPRRCAGTSDQRAPLNSFCGEQTCAYVFDSIRCSPFDETLCRAQSPQDPAILDAQRWTWLASFCQGSPPPLGKLDPSQKRPDAHAANPAWATSATTPLAHPDALLPSHQMIACTPGPFPMWLGPRLLCLPWPQSFSAGFDCATEHPLQFRRVSATAGLDLEALDARGRRRKEEK